MYIVQFDNTGMAPDGANIAIPVQCTLPGLVHVQTCIGTGSSYRYRYTYSNLQYFTGQYTHTHVHVYNTCTLTVLGETVLVLLQLTPCNHRANNKRTKPWQDGKAILQESVRRIVDRGSWIVDVHGCRELNTGAAGRYGLVYRYCRLLAPRGSRMDNAKAHNSSPWHVHLAMAVALSLALTPAQPWPWQRLWR